MTLVCVQSQALIEELLLYKRSEDQIELKEKQLSTMRVDVCSTETLKCLKGNAYIPLNRITQIFFPDLSFSDHSGFSHKENLRLWRAVVAPLVSQVVISCIYFS